MNSELYKNICNADIQNSLYTITQIILHNNDTCFSILIHTFVSICSHISSFLSIYEIKLLMEVVEYICLLIDTETIVITELYVNIAKLCILCDINIKLPVSKVGSLNIKALREKVIGIFELDNYKLSENGTTKFHGILPPHDSPSYQLSIQIISGYVHSIRESNSLDDFDEISDIANKIRQSMDYIVRKRYTFDTSFCPEDNDAIWFLWGIISILYDDTEMNMLYKLFNYDYKKKFKTSKIGILWCASLVMVYVKKTDIARTWNQKETAILNKFEEISMILYKDIKNELIRHQDNIGTPCSKELRGSGIEYMQKYRPLIHNEMCEHTNDERVKDNEIKYIKYKSKM